MRIINILFYLLLLLSINLYSDSLKIKLTNATVSKPGKAELVKLIALSGGMSTIASAENISDTHIFTDINLPEKSPILVQATYLGVNYNKIVPPVEEMRTKVQEVILYEKTTDIKNLEMNSLIQVVKEENTYRIYKVFLINNISKPAKTFFDEQNLLEIFIPTEHSELYGQLKLETSSMGVPLELPSGKLGRKLNRGILPGRSELQISYTIPIQNNSASFEDRQLLDADGNYRVLFLKPKDIQVKIEKAKENIRLEKDIPEDLSAYKINYVSTEPIYISLSGGSTVTTSKKKNVNREIVNGKYFTDTYKNIMGLTAILAILFSLSFIFVYNRK